MVVVGRGVLRRVAVVLVVVWVRAAGVALRLGRVVQVGGVRRVGDQGGVG